MLGIRHQWIYLFFTWALNFVIYAQNTSFGIPFLFFSLWGLRYIHELVFGFFRGITRNMHQLLIFAFFHAGLSADATHLLNFLKAKFLFVKNILCIHGDAILVFLFYGHRVGFSNNLFFEATLGVRLVGNHHKLTYRIYFFLGMADTLSILLFFGLGWCFGYRGLCRGTTLVYVLNSCYSRALLHCLLLLDCSLKLQPAHHPWSILLTDGHNFLNFFLGLPFAISLQDFEYLFLQKIFLLGWEFDLLGRGLGRSLLLLNNGG